VIRVPSVSGIRRRFEEVPVWVVALSITAMVGAITSVAVAVLLAYQTRPSGVGVTK
jgi:hypothetical protein